jgi:hypothetical protein
MQLESVGDLIASRILQVKEPDGSERTITVRIGRPQRFLEPPDDYFVPDRLSASEQKKSVCSGSGCRPVSLQLVMLMVGAVLVALKRKCGGTILWSDGEDLGFPLP